MGCQKKVILGREGAGRRVRDLALKEIGEVWTEVPSGVIMAGGSGLACTLEEHL